MGESLKKETIELLTLIYRANSRKDKKEVLQEARERIEVIRLFIRLMKDMKQINLKKMLWKNLSAHWWNHIYLSGGYDMVGLKKKGGK